MFLNKILKDFERSDRQLMVGLWASKSNKNLI